MSLARSLGHMLLAGIFVSGGWSSFTQPGGRVKLVDAAGIPEPQKAVELNGAAMTIAGTLLGLNIAPKLSALTLIACLVPTTFVGHPYWKEETEAAKKQQQIHFLKNLGLIGALLLVLTEKD